jgi:protein-S-isoprenylcysteine O-methyltransferase Ste14
MYAFLFPLLAGFASNLASAFTSAYSRKWGERAGTSLTVLLRDVFGIPVWGLGFALAALYPSPYLFHPAAWTTAVGWVSAAAGGAVILAALATIRMRSAAPTAHDTLAATGLYAHVRHPIHSGTILEFLGIVLIHPSLILAAACVLGVAWVILQTRFEEWDLIRRIPEYREYMSRVPRYIPRIG